MKSNWIGSRYEERLKLIVLRENELRKYNLLECELLEYELFPS
jgi:hypothetical protein